MSWQHCKRHRFDITAHRLEEHHIETLFILSRSHTHSLHMHIRILVQIILPLIGNLMKFIRTYQYIPLCFSISYCETGTQRRGRESVCVTLERLHSLPKVLVPCVDHSSVMLDRDIVLCEKYCCSTGHLQSTNSDTSILTQQLAALGHTQTIASLFIRDRYEAILSRNGRPASWNDGAAVQS
jgi:hypothetical protein